MTMTKRLIDADELLERSWRWAINSREAVQQMIEGCPTIDAEPVRHGKWITEECLPGVAICSICGHEIRGIGCQYTKYCDECGARMDEERKEE